jgi:Zn-dependent metalloprotease
MRHHYSIFCILPPYLLESLAQLGTPQQRAWALKTLSIDNAFRALRAAPPPLPTARKPPRAMALTVEGQKQRIVYDTHHSENLPGDVVRSEGDAPTGDLAVDEAYDGLGATYDLYWEIYERHSIDDEGMDMKATVHFGDKYNNAFWNGEQMVFGDGDGEIFNRFTVALDVIGHELAHGVTEDEGPLYYYFQAGALNESLSDVFGSLVRQYRLKQTADQADWLIGVGLFTASVNGVAIRSMKDPGTAYDDPRLGKDPQPGHMKDYKRLSLFQDNGGVHINSGIPNHAFYFVATNLGGHAWEKAGRIWYETLRDSRLRSYIGFKRFARLTVDNTARLFGRGSLEEQAVRDGWSRVGIAV